MGIFDFFKKEKKIQWPKNEIIEEFDEDLPIANEKIFKNGELDQLILYSAFDGRKRVIEKDDFDRLGISH